MRKVRLAWVLALVAGCSSPPSTNGTPGVTSTIVAPPANREEASSDIPELPQDPREAPLATTISELLSEDHLLHKPIDDAMSREAFPKYLEEIDGGKMFLLASQVAELERFTTKMDDEMKEGDLVLARKGAALMKQRRDAVAKLVAELLAQPFDFSSKEEVETDPKKLAWCATEADLKTRWQQLLKLQVLERVGQMEDIAEALSKKKPVNDEDGAVARSLDKIPPTFEGREEKARKELATRYASRFTRWADMEPLEPANQFINAVTSVYDPHTNYLAPAEKENFDITMTGTLEGIGAALGEEDHLIAVKELVPGGASWQQGKLEAGDLILAVAQEKEEPVDITDMPIDKVVKMIRGPKGTVVTLTVKKADGHIETISITRDVIKIEASYARGAVLALGKKKDKVGYIYLPGFYGDTRGGSPDERNATDDVRKLLETFQKQHLSGVIIDLRGNGGGLLAHARDISGLLIDKGPVVQVRGSDNKVDVLSDTNAGVAFTGNVVVMVDRFSASASEILAGALQDYERAVIVGTNTHGKGTVQTLVDLDKVRGGRRGGSLGVLKLTIEQYYRIDGESTQWGGVKPDVPMPDPAAYVDSGERTLFHSIPASTIEPLRFPLVKHAWDKKKLDEASEKRQAAEPAFGKVTAFTKVIKERRDTTKVNLEKATWAAERKKNKAQLDAVDPKLSEGKPRLEVTTLDDPAEKAPAKAPADKGAEKVRKRLDKWREDLSRDPWVAESLNILDDMAKAK